MSKQEETRDRVLDLVESLEVGQPIPAERQLATDLGVSRLTLRAALDDLVRDGYLDRRHGSGTYVTEPKIAQPLTLTSFSDDMRRRGMTPGSRTLELTSTLAGARLAHRLGVSPEARLFRVKRLRLADSMPMAMEILHVPEALVPGLTRADFEGRSFYELLRERYGITVASGTQSIEPTVTNEDESEVLGVPLHTPANQSGTLTVWLMNGSAPQSVVDGVNSDFKAKYPNVTVNVEIQQWGEIGTKLDTAFAGSSPPDVIELGNTLVAKYAAAGALEDISGKQSSFDNSGTWLQSLTDSCTVSSKLYCVPYYAGSRAIIYRKDFFTAANVQPPDSMDGLLTVGQKLMTAHSSDPNFSALYFPGKYWYAALPFVWDFGGAIATQSGRKWQGSINSSSSQQGLTKLNSLVAALSRADKTGDEAKQDAAFAQGHIAMIIANGWEVGVITDPKAGDPSLKDKLGAFPIPSHTATLLNGGG